MPKRSNDFQRLIYLIKRCLADERSTVEESVMLIDRQTGAEVEVDVVIRTEIAGTKIVVGVECTATGRPATVEWINKNIAKHEFLTDKIVLVSKEGFTAEAVKKAVANNALTLALEDAEQSDWTQIAGHPREIHVAQSWFRPLTIAIIPKPKALDINAPVFGPDKKRLGTLREVADAIVNATVDEETVAEHLNPGQPAVVFTVFKTMPAGTYAVGPYVEHQAIDEIRVEVFGGLQSAPVELAHSMLGDARVSHGTAASALSAGEGKPRVVIVEHGDQEGHAAVEVPWSGGRREFVAPLRRARNSEKSGSNDPTQGG